MDKETQKKNFKIAVAELGMSLKSFKKARDVISQEIMMLEIKKAIIKVKESGTLA